MELEKELSEELLEAFLPCRTKRQLRKKGIVKEMLNAILPFLKQVGPFDPTPNVQHLRDVVTLYWRWKSLRISSEIESYFEKKIIGYMLKICHYWWLDDRSVVIEILHYFYEAYGDFMEVIYGTVEEGNGWKVLFRWRNWLLPCFKSKDNSPLAYCLIHYSSSRLTLNGVRFVDVPFPINDTYVSGAADCFENAKPRELLLLMQYGATMSGVDCAAAEADACFELLFSTLTSIWNDIASAGYRISEGCSVILSSDYWKKKVQCTNILIKTSPQMTLYLNGDQSFVNGTRSLLLTIEDYLPSIIRRLIDPCELKHLCRLKIRRVLNRSWGLPREVDRLCLPQDLKDYLNLLKE